MSYRVRYTRAARDDLLRLFSFLLERDPQAAILARGVIGKSIVALQEFLSPAEKPPRTDPFCVKW